MKLSDFIKQTRLNTGMTLKEFGNTIECSRKMLAHYENGKFIMPDEAILAFSKEYGILESELIAMRDKQDVFLDFGENPKPLMGYDYEYVINENMDVFRKKYVSRDGKFIKSKKLSQSLGKNGYYYVNLKKNGKTKLEYVHRLMGKAYIPNPEGKPQINHKNGIKTDNRIENLEWVTEKENAVHAVVNGLSDIGEESKKSKLTLEEAIQIKNSSGSDTETAEVYGVSRAQVRRIKEGINWRIAIQRQTR